MKSTFMAQGLVYGYLWGGGEGAYEARTIRASSRKQILEMIESDLKSGALDGGMGYESLIGAYMAVTEIVTTTIDGREFTHKDTEMMFFGKLDEKQKEFLETIQ